MKFVRDLGGHVAFIVLAIGVLFLLPGVPDGGSPGYGQLAQASEPVSGEATNSCVALSQTSMAGGQPREVGEFCLVVASLGSDKLTCTPDDTLPPGTCKVHYCDPTGCHDTTTHLPSDIQNIEDGVSRGAITPDSNFDTTGAQTTGFEDNLDANGYNQSSGFPPGPQPSGGPPGVDQGMSENSTPIEDSVLFDPNGAAPTPDEFSGNGDLYESIPAKPDAADPMNSGDAGLAPGSAYTDAPTGDSTFSNPNQSNTIDLPQNAGTQNSFLDSATTQIDSFVAKFDSFFGIQTAAPNPCPDGVCTQIGIRG
jgi:hypothetical protein